MIKLKSKLKRILSFFTTFVLATSSLTTAITPMTVQAANVVNSPDIVVDSLKDATVKGYGKFDLESDSSGYEIEHSKNLTKAKKSDWIWQSGDQGATGAIGEERLGNAYIAELKDDSYWIQYNDIELRDTDDSSMGTYDVRVVFSNPKGAISGAYGKDIAVFDGQLGAVRFRGYKSIDCEIFVYKHGTKQLVSGKDGMMHMRFIDIDCHQAVQILTPGRVDWAYKRNKLSWMGQNKCNEIGAEYGNTV